MRGSKRVFKRREGCRWGICGGEALLSVADGVSIVCTSERDRFSNNFT